jgi:hypothetical protein
MKHWFSILAVLVACAWSSAQDANLSLVRELRGNQAAITVAGKTYIEAAAQLGPPVGIITLPDHTWEYLRFSRDGETFKPAAAEPNRYVLAEPGNYWIIIAYGTADSKQFDKEFIFTIGDAPNPPNPPTPPPNPPTPPVPPNPDIPNEYNVGKIAYSAAPNDQALAVTIASWYKAAANAGYGIGGLKPIEFALEDLNRKFDARKCKDEATCAKWAAWKIAVDAALREEQKRRGTFTRENWYKCLNEIATALEAVK